MCSGMEFHATELIDNKFTSYVALAQNSFMFPDTPRLSKAEKEEVDSIVEDFCKASNLQLKELHISYRKCKT